MMLKDLLPSLFHPSEILSLFYVKYGKQSQLHKKSSREYTGNLEYLAEYLNDYDFCFAVLNKVSRSFAIVIQQLPHELKTAVCIFYLVLRGLDSVEDDMSYNNAEKIQLLHTFYQKLYQPEWCIKNVGDSYDYRVLLANFQKVIRVFLALNPKYQNVIQDITKQMGYGMAEFAAKINTPTAYSSSSAQPASSSTTTSSSTSSKQINGTATPTQTHMNGIYKAASPASPSGTTPNSKESSTAEKYNVESIADYNQYCYYVAGLVGSGLSSLFHASGLESNPSIMNDKSLWNSMGMFLQKTNIIRDYLEDLHAERMWWPKEIWSQYGTSLHDFRLHPYNTTSLQCLNHMITDALQLVPHVLEYLSLLDNQQIFEFCAIPQVMAMATLAEIYNNHYVFQRNVKIRKGLTCRILLYSKTQQQVYEWFYEFSTQMRHKVHESTDRYYDTTLQLLEQIQQYTATTHTSPLLDHNQPTPASSSMNGHKVSTHTHTHPPGTSSIHTYFSPSLAWLLLLICLFILYTKRVTDIQPSSPHASNTLLDHVLSSFTLRRSNSIELGALLGGSFSAIYLINTIFAKI